ncbi:MAG: hypothetical protein WAT25_07715 [Paracoccaceae bacterium]
MSIFATEFRTAATLSHARFAAEVVAWLRGIKDCRIFDSATERDLDGDSANLRSATGEVFLMQRFSDADGSAALGFRYDAPDKMGRTWRTEGVLRDDGSQPETRVLRIRGQCLATATVARLETPIRPHLLRSLLEEGFGARDELLDVSTAPQELTDNEAGLATGAALVDGKATRDLPVIYVSATGNGAWVVSRRSLERLAIDLCGVAHVVLEPSRGFSFGLREQTDDRNPYGGTIGIALPGHGVVRRFFLGWAIPDEAALLAEVRTSAIAMRTNMGRRGGWDWLDLQEAAIRQQRHRDRSRLSFDETEKLWQEELASKEERIADLERQLASQRQAAAEPAVSGRLPEPLLSALGRELYDGEFIDRLRAALRDIVTLGADRGWDRRSLALFAIALEKMPASAGLARLREDLDRATRDVKKLANNLPPFLEKLGYQHKSDKTHIRMTPDPDLIGAESMTVPNSASDHRAGENQKSDTLAALGLKRL